MPLNVDERGSGPPLVMLHGLFGSGRNWQSVANKLADRYHVLSVDARNHGRSFHDDTINYPVMADDVMQLIQDRGLESPTLLGHSMGGKTAMRVALTAPDLIDRLVVVDIAPVDYPLRFVDLIDAMESVPLASLEKRSEADAFLQARIPDQFLRMFLLQNLAFEDGRYSWRVNLPAIRAALPDLMSMPADTAAATFTAPTLFIRGGQSPAVSPRHHEAIHSHFPDASIVTIETAGHLPHTEQPAAFLEVLNDFLDRTGDV
ncbi:MAG: alpha/beta fold hydrolase [Gammaproteobacteria bacterium]|nr:alpha/beta fold hydrolase [Gammaproteobacteria bacterium]